MMVLKAMLIDAYRELNAKKLFWVVLGLSGLVVLLYGSMGFDDDGLFLFYGLWQIESEFIQQGSPIATLMYRTIFTSFIVGIWLAWIATILALISTATIFPDFMASGAIDLVLSKPLRRVSLFFYKYLGGLLFMILLTSVFCTGIFVCMGWRIGEWNWLIFAAVPLLAFFYSILFSVCVLVGVVTRSSLASLLLTMLFWFSLFSIAATEAIMNQFRIDLEISGETEAIEKLDLFYRPVKIVQAVLPKTGETIDLLDRWLKDPDEPSFTDLVSGNIEMADDGSFVVGERQGGREVQARLEADYASRSMWYVLGTSAAFEAVILGLACFIFVRRDY